MIWTRASQWAHGNQHGLPAERPPGSGAGSTICAIRYIVTGGRRRTGVNDEGHSGMDVSQDVGAVLAHALSSKVRRGQQTPAQEAEVVPFTPSTPLGSPQNFP